MAGRPSHKPDRRTRELVSALALNGITQDRIAAHAGISEPSSSKAYRQELDLATESVCAPRRQKSCSHRFNRFR